MWLAAPAMGAALGCVWTADRVFMIRLTPLELRGQMFGFFNLASRVASAFGPLVIWSATIWILHSQTEWLSLLGATRVALVGLALAAFVGWLVIRPLSDAYRSPAIEAREVRLGGFEPPTGGLEGRCSSTELQAPAGKRTADPGAGRGASARRSRP